MRIYLLVVAFFISGYGYSQSGSDQPFIKVSGEVTKPLTLYKQDLAKMKRSTVMLKDRLGKEQSYTGVVMQEIMEAAGATMGNNLKGENLAKYLMVRCADNYEVLFSLAELDSSFTDRIVILADEMEGKPLPDGKGPFRLIVPGEKKPARSSMQVVEFIVRYAKD